MVDDPNSLEMPDSHDPALAGSNGSSDRDTWRSPETNGRSRSHSSTHLWSNSRSDSRARSPPARSTADARTDTQTHSGGEASDWWEASSSVTSRNRETGEVAVDPINYDIDELRSLTDGEITTQVRDGHPENYRVHIPDPTPEQFRRLLLLEEIDPTTIGEKPYLTELPTDAAGGFVLDWLTFLTEEAGTDGAFEAISQYREIGWFTERIERKLWDSMLWIEYRDGFGITALDRADHLLSFAYMAKIASISTTNMEFY